MIFLKELTLNNADNILKDIFNTRENFEYEYISHSTQDTRELGKKFGEYISQGDIITLNGELGSGKTVFLNGLASFFGIEDDVCSPTFTIVNEYNIDRDFPIYHFDVYRIKDSDEFLEGVGTDYFYNGACLIEWGDEIISDILPKNTIHIDIYKNETDKELRTFRIWRKS